MALHDRLIDLRSTCTSMLASSALLLIPAAIAIWSVTALQPNLEYRDNPQGSYEGSHMPSVFDSPICNDDDDCDDDDDDRPVVIAEPTATSVPPSQVVALTTAIRNANLRAGPGVSFKIVGQVIKGQPLQLTAKNGDGRWYQLVSGAWIAAFLVNNAPELPLYVQSTSGAGSSPSSQQLPLLPTANRNANLRAGPGVNFAIAGHVTAGQTLQLAAKSADGRWYRLASGTWIASFLVNNAPAVPYATDSGQ